MADSEGLPKYLKLAAALRERIAAGTYPLSERMPSEEELGTEFSVSRITVRQAMDLLARERLVVREQGRGTFVAPPKLRRDISSIYSFSADMRRLGMAPTSTCRERSLAVPTDEEARSLDLDSTKDRVIRVERVRRANGIPVLLERTAIAARLCSAHRGAAFEESDLNSFDLENGSLYSILWERYGLWPAAAEEFFEAIILSSEDAGILECPIPEGQPGLAIIRIARLGDGRPLEYTRSIGRGDRLSFSVTMRSGGMGIGRKIEV
jgi:GntR family transcriptional regulator